jgi:hypothetical protein
VKAPDVRISTRRAISGSLIALRVFHKELTAEGRILLILGDERGRALTISIAAEVLADVGPPAPIPLELAADAENRVIDRLVH